MEPTMKTELAYKIEVEPAVFAILNQVAQDVSQFDIEPDHFVRAVWAWADTKLEEYDAPPQWLWTELARARQASDAANTIEGEAGER